MSAMSYEDLETIVASYVAANKQAGAFVMSTNNIVGLLDKIAKTITIDTSFEDPLTELDGDDLPLGKTIEEYMLDLITPENYDDTGANALAPHDITSRANYYSYTLGRKKFRVTYRYDNLERACNTEAEFNQLVTMITKRLYDSFAVFKFGAKKQLLSNVVAKCAAVASASAFNAATAYNVGDYVTNSGSYGVVFRAIPASSSVTWATRVSQGDIVVLKLIETIAEPTDADSGEDFILAIKQAVEETQFPTQENTLSGALIGRVPSLSLYIKKGYMPLLDVKTISGAFHEANLAIPAAIHVVDAFPGEDDVVAMLIDPRGVKLHNGYRSVREQVNGDGDFINYFLHTENTGFISANTFVRIWKKA